MVDPRRSTSQKVTWRKRDRSKNPSAVGHSSNRLAGAETSKLPVLRNAGGEGLSQECQEAILVTIEFSAWPGCYDVDE